MAIKAAWCPPVSVWRPVLLVRSQREEQTEGMMGDLGLDDGSSSGLSHLCTLSIAGQTGCIVFLRVTSRVRRGRTEGGPAGGVEGQEVRRGERLGVGGVGGALSRERR